MEQRAGNRSDRAVHRRRQRPRTPPVAEPPLIIAARQCDSATIARLLQQGCDPNLCDARGRTALHHAVQIGDAETAACLLAHGAGHALVDGSGRAAHDPHTADVELLHAIRHATIATAALNGRASRCPPPNGGPASSIAAASSRCAGSSRPPSWS